LGPQTHTPATVQWWASHERRRPRLLAFGQALLHVPCVQLEGISQSSPEVLVRYDRAPRYTSIFKDCPEIQGSIATVGARPVGSLHHRAHRLGRTRKARIGAHELGRLISECFEPRSHWTP